MSKVGAIRFGAAAAAVAAVVSGCSSSTAGSATPPAGTSSSSGATSMLASAVPKALPTDALVANSCSALSAAQVTKIGLNGGGTFKPDNLGGGCTWKSATSTLNYISISPLTVNANGLSDIYRNKAKDAYFEPTTIDGYPGVYAGPDDARAQGTCALWIGVTDQLAVSVLSQIGEGPNKTNPCPVTARVAEAMINHLQGTE